MRLISWNANCRFRDKYHLLNDFDVAVVQECEDPKQSTNKSYATLAERSFWLGKIKHKGLGIFLGEDTQADIMKLPETTQEYFLPLQLSSGKQILAVWAMGAKRVQDGYIAQIHDYLRTHEQYFDWANLTIVGDFNSNAQWDGKRELRNHGNLVKKLDKKGLTSLYHCNHEIEHGHEEHPTFYMYRKLERPYHIDYVFIPQHAAKTSSIAIGDPNDWLIHSDHMPLFADSA